MTLLRRLQTLLEKQQCTVRMLATELDIPPEEVLLLIDFLAKKVSIRRTVPHCNHCGFVFAERAKAKPPTRCPACTYEDISDPFYFI